MIARHRSTSAASVAAGHWTNLWEVGLVPALDEQLACAHDLISALIPGHVATLDVVRDVQEQAPGAIQVFEERSELSGVLALLPLSAKGLQDLELGIFDGLAPEDAQIADREALPAAFYAWGAAASTKEAARAVIGGTAHFCARVRPYAPVYAFAATPAGERSLKDRLGFRPLSPCRPNLLVRPSWRLAA